MKCDVCLTNIPLGQNECPNCGFKMKVNHVNTFDASGKDHNHIQVKSKYIKSRVQTPKRQNRTQQKPIITKIIFIFIILSIVFQVLSTVFLGVNSFIRNSYVTINEEDYVDLTFEDVLNEDMDENGTVECASETKDDIIQMLDDNGYEDISTGERCYKYSVESSLRAYLDVDTYKDERHYQIHYVFTEGYEESVEMVVSGNQSGKISKKDFCLKETDVTEITDYVGIDNAYNYLKNAHMNMQKDDDNSYKYSNYDGPNIYMNEEFNDSSESYYYYYLIGVDR